MSEKLSADLNIIQSAPIELELLDGDLNIIQKLDDEPNDVGGLTSAELKAKFDESGNIIKKYINETLIPALLAEGVLGAGLLVQRELGGGRRAKLPDDVARRRALLAGGSRDAGVEEEGLAQEFVKLTLIVLPCGVGAVVEFAQMVLLAGGVPLSELAELLLRLLELPFGLLEFGCQPLAFGRALLLLLVASAVVLAVQLLLELRLVHAPLLVLSPGLPQVLLGAEGLLHRLEDIAQPGQKRL